VTLPAREWAGRGLGLALGALFVYASLDKIAQPADFARIVYHYRLIGPDRLIPPLVPNLLAVTLPWIELLVGLLLAAGVWRREAAGLAAGLLVVFLVAVGAALYRGIDIENCGCFSVGAGGRGAGVLLLAEDTAMLAVALTLWRWRSRRSPAD
jgi:uncharacterized membrane protein YphA (DoxX/SURF4 family)